MDFFPGFGHGVHIQDLGGHRADVLRGKRLGRSQREHHVVIEEAQSAEAGEIYCTQAWLAFSRRINLIIAF